MNMWDGYCFKKVYIDENGMWFEGGVAKYAAYYYNKLIGYADSDKKAENLFLQYRGFKR